MPELIRECAEKHAALASKYEALGNADAAARLRAVSNLLYALLEGTYRTILPELP